jgi:hypothetical protein
MENYPIIQRVDLAYDSVEDRLVLWTFTSEGPVKRLLITRRLSQRLLDNYVAILTEESPAMGAPKEFSNDIHHIEHFAAVAAYDKDTESPQKTNVLDYKDASVAFLVTEALLQVKENKILLAFKGRATNNFSTQINDALNLAAFKLDRPVAHKLLSMLIEKLDESNWCIDSNVDWARGGKNEKLDGALN